MGGTINKLINEGGNAGQSQALGWTLLAGPRRHRKAKVAHHLLHVFVLPTHQHSAPVALQMSERGSKPRKIWIREEKTKNNILCGQFIGCPGVLARLNGHVEGDGQRSDGLDRPAGDASRSQNKRYAIVTVLAHFDFKHSFLMSIYFFQFLPTGFVDCLQNMFLKKD